MKISQAIEILTKLPNTANNDLTYDQCIALKLGIEALKRHRDKDYTTYAGMHEPLPGETPAEKAEK